MRHLFSLHFFYLLTCMQSLFVETFDGDGNDGDGPLYFLDDHSKVFVVNTTVSSLSVQACMYVCMSVRTGVNYSPRRSWRSSNIAPEGSFFWPFRARAASV